MTTTPRKFDSEIRITANGKWIFRGQEITQDNVLGFLRKISEKMTWDLYYKYL